jgi:hypothetical protein
MYPVMKELDTTIREPLQHPFIHADIPIVLIFPTPVMALLVTSKMVHLKILSIVHASG